LICSIHNVLKAARCVAVADSLFPTLDLAPKSPHHHFVLRIKAAAIQFAADALIRAVVHLQFPFATMPPLPFDFSTCSLNMPSNLSCLNTLVASSALGSPIVGSAPYNGARSISYFLPPSTCNFCPIHLEKDGGGEEQKI
jgi:hypothetical protein